MSDNDETIDDLNSIIDDTKDDLQDTIDDTEDHTDDSSTEETHEDDGHEDEGSSGDEGSSDDGASEEEEDEDEGEYDGVASAYKRDKKKKDDKPSGPNKDFAPFGRGHWTGVKKEGKLIGEVLYDQLIEFIEYLLKKTVDIPLDFADYALYKAFTSFKKYPKKEENEEKNVFDYGREIEKGYAERAAEGIGFYKNALNEVLENVEKNKRGEPLEWNVLRGQPDWFDKAVQLEREASADPTSEAAKKWERFKNSDKIIEGRLGNEAVYRIISTRMATFEEAMKGENFKLPENVEKKMKEMDRLLMEDDINAADLKTKMAAKIGEMRTMVEGGGFVNTAINAKLDAMQGITEGSEENVQTLKNSFRKPLSDIKEINPTPEHIKTLSREDYEQITKNIDKIREKYKDNPAMKVEVISSYVNGIIESLNNAQEDVIKYDKANRFSKSKIAEKTKKTIYGLINKAGDYIGEDGKPIISLKTQKEKAENGIKAVKSAINDFEVESIKISEYADATRRSSAPSSEKPEMLRQMSKYFRSR